MGSKSQDSTSISYSMPPPEVSQAYRALMQLAQAGASQPLRQYGGPRIAGFTPDQAAAFDSVRDAQGIWQPYVNTASQYAAQGAEPTAGVAQPYIDQASQATSQGMATIADTVDPRVQDPYIGEAHGLAQGAGAGIAGDVDPFAGQAHLGSAAGMIGRGAQSISGDVPQWSNQQVSQYLNPYQQNVIDTTMANMRRQDQLAQEDLLGRAIQSGASPFGGDRAGLAAAELARNQGMARNQVIADLERQGYESAVDQFNRQQDVARQVAEGDRAAAAGAAGQYMGLAGASLDPQRFQADVLAGDRAAQGQAAGLISGLGQQALTGEQFAADVGERDAQRALQASGLYSGLGQLQGQLASDDAARALQASGLYSGLGQQAQQQQLAGADALLRTGAMQQGLGQQQLDLAYQQFQQQANYPRDMAQWAAGIISGGAPMMQGYGTTSQTTSQPGPSPIGQIAGLGLGTLGLFLNRGGRARYAEGGGIDIPLLPTASSPGSGGLEGISAPSPIGTPITVPTEPGFQHGPQTYINALPQLNWKEIGGDPIITELPPDILDALKSITQPYNPFGAYGFTPAPTDGVVPPGPVPPTFGPGMKARGGGVPRRFLGGTLASLGSIGSTLANLGPVQTALLKGGLAMMSSDEEGALGQIGEGINAGLGHIIDMRKTDKKDEKAGGGGVDAHYELDDHPVVNRDGSTIRVHFPNRKEWLDTGLPSGKKPDRKAFGGETDDEGLSPLQLALISAGLNMMASDSPYPLSQIGQGGAAGLQAYLGARKARKAEDKERSETEARDAWRRERMPSMSGGTGAVADQRSVVPDDMSIYRDAISGIESGGNYAALGPVTKSGDRAYGRYQVMGANIPVWTEQVLGKALTPDEFLADPKAQDAIFDGIFGGYVKSYGPEEAASRWFTGRSIAEGADATDQLGTTGAEYVRKFSDAVGRPRPVQVAQAGGQPSLDDLYHRQAEALALGYDREAKAIGSLIDARQIALTDDVKEYRLYRQQAEAAGEQPMSFLDYQQALRKSGATNVSIDQRQQSEFEKALGKSMADQYIQIQDAGRQAQAKIGKLHALGGALADARTGFGAETMLNVRRAAGALGIDVEGDIGSEETSLAIGNQLALELRNPSGGAGMPGAMSDRDREFLVASIPGLSRTPEGNARLIEYMTRVEQRNVEIAKLANEYMDRHGQIDHGFYAELAKWSAANPLFREALVDDAKKKLGEQLRAREPVDYKTFFGIE